MPLLKFGTGSVQVCWKRVTLRPREVLTANVGEYSMLHIPQGRDPRPESEYVQRTNVKLLPEAEARVAWSCLPRHSTHLRPPYSPGSIWSIAIMSRRPDCTWHRQGAWHRICLSMLAALSSLLLVPWSFPSHHVFSQLIKFPGKNLTRRLATYHDSQTFLAPVWIPGRAPMSLHSWHSWPSWTC